MAVLSSSLMVIYAPGISAGFRTSLIKICWVAISYIMIQKGDKHLDVLTIGGTIITFLIFIPSGLYRATLTISSNLLGAKNYEEIGKLFRSFSIYTLLIAALLTIPLLVFPTSMIVSLIPHLSKFLKKHSK